MGSQEEWLVSSVDGPAVGEKITRIGVFSQVHGKDGQRIESVYADLLDAIVAADELGVDIFWVGQHHVDPSSGRLPSPLPLLAVAAERTRRIRLGTAVSVLPLEDPIRLAEDAVVVDTLSGGRLELGLGAGGGSARGYSAFGIDNQAQSRRALFDAKLDRLLAALGGQPLAVDPDTVRLEPPAATLADRVWASAGTVERAAQIGARGLRLLTGTFSDTQQFQREKILAYRKAYLAAGHDPAAIRVSAGRFTYTGASRAQIEAQVAQGLRTHQRRVAEFDEELATLSVSDYLRRVTRYGTIDDVIDSLRSDVAIVGLATDFHSILSLYPAAGAVTLGTDVELARIRELVEVIAPALGWHPNRGRRE
ncbi:MAG: LLM class flavin-dependent oxidoreductase [Gordonia sp. (in: high G+C Gram-positive bacteria)]